MKLFVAWVAINLLGFSTLLLLGTLLLGPLFPFVGRHDYISQLKQGAASGGMGEHASFRLEMAVMLAEDADREAFRAKVLFWSAFALLCANTIFALNLYYDTVRRTTQAISRPPGQNV